MIEHTTTLLKEDCVRSLLIFNDSLLRTVNTDINVWDLRNYSLKEMLVGHGDNILSLAPLYFSYPSKRFLSSSEEEIIIWQPHRESYEQYQRIHLHVEKYSLLTSGHLAVFDNSTILIWNYVQDVRKQLLRGTYSTFTRKFFNQNLFFSLDTFCNDWEKAENNTFLIETRDKIRNIELSSDQKFVFIEGKKIIIEDVFSEHFSVVEGHSSHVNCFYEMSKGKIISSCPNDLLHIKSSSKIGNKRHVHFFSCTQ